MSQELIYLLYGIEPENLKKGHTLNQNRFYLISSNQMHIFSESLRLSFKSIFTIILVIILTTVVILFPREANKKSQESINIDPEVPEII